MTSQLSPQWRRELRVEIAAHHTIGMPPLALLLQAAGIDSDLATPMYYMRARHAPAEHDPRRAWPVAGCPECMRLKRMHAYLTNLINSILAPLGPWGAYSPLRSLLSPAADDRAARLQRPQVEAWCAQPETYWAPLLRRFRTSDLREALLVALWIARQYFRLSHAPGACAAEWRSAFERDGESRTTALAATLRRATSAGDA